MKTRLLFSAAAVAAILSSTAAGAQGWTVSVLGGETWEPHITLGPGIAAPESGFNAGGRIGYSLDDWMPVSGFSLAGDVFYSHSHFRGSSTSSDDSLSGMGDLIYHLDTGWPVGIYGGAGAGAVSTGFRTDAFEDRSTVLGWQALGGVDYAFSPDTTLFAEYRYLNAHDANLTLPGGVANGRVGNTSNNLSVGLKFNL